jgi:hypothetical protein
MGAIGRVPQLCDPELAAGDRHDREYAMPCSGSMM